MESCEEAYARGYLEGKLSDRSPRFPDVRVPKEGKQLEWLLYEILGELKKLNEALRAR